MHLAWSGSTNISNSDGWSLFWEVEGETYGGGHHDGSRYQTSSEATLILRLKTECKQLVFDCNEIPGDVVQHPTINHLHDSIFFAKRLVKTIHKWWVHLVYHIPFRGSYGNLRRPWGNPRLHGFACPRHPLPWAFGRSGLGSILPTWSPTLWLGRNVEIM